MGSMVADVENAPRCLRVFFIPWFATGHMIPLVDIARLFAARGVDSTLLLTPANACLVRSTVDRASAAGLPLNIVVYPFPSAESGLPHGVENISALPPSESYKIDEATPFARPAHHRLLSLHRPDAVVADTHFPWTTSIAKDLKIPRISFHAIGLFPVSVMGAVFRHLPHLADGVGDDEAFLVPGLPDPVYMVRPELPDFLRGNTHITESIDELTEAEKGCLGVIVNSFADIEPGYADHYLQADGKRTWLVGPVALAAYSTGDDIAARGGNDQIAGTNRARCLAFLEGKEPRSVVYVCFGSWSHFSGEQLREMALGLEAAGHPFIWVTRDAAGEGWMPEGYKERVAGRGLVIRGWAPQLLVLGHAATGGFVTHCGWNSVLEGAAAGLPMVTWPLSTEQFMNEKLAVGVLKVAVKAYEGFRSTAEGEQSVVPAAEVEKAVKRIMGPGEEADERRRRAAELGEKARAAVRESGSSHEGLSRLIDEIREWQEKNKAKKDA